MPAATKRFTRPLDPDAAARRAREVRQGVREVTRAMKTPRLSLDEYRAQQAWFEVNRQDYQQRKGG